MLLASWIGGRNTPAVRVDLPGSGVVNGTLELSFSKNQKVICSVPGEAGINQL